MSQPPAPVPPAPLTRWLLPLLTVLTVGGVLFLGLHSSGPEETARPVPKPAGPTTQTQVPAVVAATTPLPVQAAPAAVTPVGDPKVAPTFVQNMTPIPAVPAAAVQVPPNAGTESLTDPLPSVQALAPGEPALARVSVGGVSTPLLSPNQVGTFPRVYVAQGGQADVQIQLPEASSGDQVLVGAEDGGSFADGKSVAALTVDEHHAVAFRFQVGQFPGNYRVTVRHRAQSKTVLLWAGDRALAANL